MMALQRMPKYVIEHRYCVTEHIPIKYVGYFQYLLKYNLKNVRSPITSLCNNIILLFEFILQRFMDDIHIVWKSSYQ